MSRDRAYAKKAWPFLCTYPRGEPRKLEPLTTYKNAPRHKGVCIANACCEGMPDSGFPLFAS